MADRSHPYERHHTREERVTARFYDDDVAALDALTTHYANRSEALREAVHAHASDLQQHGGDRQ